MNIIAKLKEGLRNPKLVWFFLFRKKYRWADWEIRDGFKRKRYSSYDEYLEHQKKKLKQIHAGTYEWFAEYDQRYRRELGERLKHHGRVNARQVVLCLAARIGTEVKAFQDLGCFAVGLDLNPGKDNKYVLYGDFHAIQFPDHSVDVVFCNSLDHAFDLEKLFAEIKRVLRPGGLVVLEINAEGEQAGASAGYFESVSWPSAEDLLQFLKQKGFQALVRSSFEYPWKGIHVCLSGSDA